MHKSMLSPLVLVPILFAVSSCSDAIVNPDPAGGTMSLEQSEATNSVVGVSHLDVGEAQVIYDFSDQPTELVREPLGVAVDPRGNIFVSDRKGDGVQYLQNEILMHSPRGVTTVVADLGAAEPGCFGVVGLAADPRGDVYAAFGSCNSNHGVWKVSPSGNKQHLAGSQNIAVPNEITLDPAGNIYVTDSYPVDPDGPGLIWRYGKKGLFEIWASSVNLAPDPDIDPFGFPAPGANGIAFYPPNHIYVANTEKSVVLDIPILPDGSAGSEEIVAGVWPPTDPTSLLTAPDGFAVDVRGMIYAAVPPAGLAPFPLSPVIRIDPSNGEVTAVVEPYTVPSLLFDFPVGLAFGRGYLDRKSLYVVNATSAGIVLGSGPAVTQVGIGVAGR